MPKSVDLARYRILAIFNTLIAHDTVLEDLRFFDVDLAHEIPWIGFKFVDSSALEYPKMEEEGDHTQLQQKWQKAHKQILFKINSFYKWHNTPIYSTLQLNKPT